MFFAKTLLIIFVFMWVRWSLPRFRFDQIMNMAWRAMIPISLAMLLATTLVIYGFGPHDAGFIKSGLISWKMAAVLLIVNVVTLIIVMIASTLVPPAPATNRRIRIIGSRFENTPVPAGAATAGGAA